MQPETNRDLERAFELAGPAGTRAFLEGLLAADALMRRQFISLFGGKGAETLKEELSAELEDIGSWREEGGEEDWDNTFNRGCNYELLVRAHLDPVFKRGDDAAAFALLDVVMDDLRDYSLDDTNGFSYGAIEIFCDYLKRALTMTPAADVPARFAEVTAMCDGLLAVEGTEQEGGYDSAIVTNMDKLLVDLYADRPRHARLVADWAARRFAALEPGDHRAASWIRVRLRAMRAAGEPAEDMLLFAKPQLTNLDVALMMAGALEERGDLDSACDLLEGALMAAGKRSRTTCAAEVRLLKLYGACGREDDELRLLEEMLLCEDTNSELPTVRAWQLFKARCPEEEWPETRERMLSNMQSAYKICDCLEEEGLDERLVATLEETGTSPAPYEMFLLQAGHTKFVMGSCWKTIWRMACRANKRSNYKDIARQLGHVAHLPGGESYARKMASIIREEYPGRPALHDEIDKVGL